MSAPQNPLWPCYSCCQQIWVPGDATFGDGCPGLLAYVPVWLSLLVLLCRYALRPLWRRRPLWLRDFATEEDELGLRKSPSEWAAGGDGDGGENAQAEAPVAEDVSDGPPLGGNGSGLVSPNLAAWSRMAVTLCLFSAAGVITCLSLTFAAGLGFLYLTPLVPRLAACAVLAIDRPRSLPGAVLLLHGSTLLIQTALFVGVPALARWPQNLSWLAEIGVTGLSVGMLLLVPMRDPRLGTGSADDKIAAVFETPSNHFRSPEDNFNLWQWMSVSWMAPLIGLATTRQLNDEDIWALPFQFQHARLYRLFRDVRGSVTARVLKANAPDLILTSALGIFSSILSMLPILFLKQLLSVLERPDASTRVALVYCVLICVANMARTQTDVFALWFSRRCYERSRGELITMIYQKTLRRKAFTFPGLNSSSTPPDGGEGGDEDAAGPAATSETADSGVGDSAPASTGKILNLMRNDVYEVAQRFWDFSFIFTKPLNFLLPLYLLWRVLGGASLLGIFVLLVAQVLNAYIIRVLVQWETARRAVTDVKLQITSQFIESIRHLRWYDWQDKWLVDILATRKKELRYRVITNLIQNCINLVNETAAAFLPVTAFYAFTVIEKRPLTVDVAFPALNLFSILQQSLHELPNLITVFLNASIAMGRIEAFMAEPDKEEQSDEEDTPPLDPASNEPVGYGLIRSPGPLRIEIRNAAFAWPTATTLVLSGVNFSVDGPGLYVVYGKVGTGKTALLLSILGEMDQHSGICSVPREAFAYCAQTPWLQSMTLRENILFCLPYDEQRYNRVIEACCLLPDFAEFGAGDLSSIGENGVGLSGGQKARVALARAVYSRARILLLDDPIAALDHHTAELILERLFQTSGLMQDRLTVLVTHRLELAAPHADRVFEVSDEKGIVAEVSKERVQQGATNASPGPSGVSLPTSSATSDENEESITGDEGSGSPSSATCEEGDATAVAPAETTPRQFIEEEHRAHGGVVLAVYWRYIKAGGLRLWLLTAMAFVGYRGFKVIYLYFLKQWGEAYDSDRLGLLSQTTASQASALSWAWTHSPSSTAAVQTGNNDVVSLDFSMWPKDNFGLPSPDSDVRPWLFWFFVLSFSLVFFRTLAELLLVAITYTAGKQVFQQVMQRVTSAPFRFFDVTPVGRLMNRVTSDIGTMDGAVARQIQNCGWMILMWVSSIFVIATATPTFLVMAIFMTVLFFLVFLHFLPASQSLRRLETVSLSPLMSNFGTLLDGLTTVRAFRAQPHFQDRVINTTDTFQRMDHFYWSLQNWLQWRFNVMSALSTFSLAVTAVATGLSSGLVAFVLTAATRFVHATQVLCRQYGELQMQFVSVERVFELLDLDEEPVGRVTPPAGWPTYNDDIVFDNVTIRYAPQLEPSLRAVSMRIPAGSTVAVTGRTGSGKSTLALALLGTILADDDEKDPGGIWIGSMNVATVNKHALRQRISFVAQDPVLFPGSVRENLDPIGEHSDEECRLVLGRVLDNTAGDLTLTSRVDGGGKNMSLGQRQLIGLGRAVLRRSPIVILDEATASIDKKTAFRIQSILREELRQSTVITIAHRVEAVRDADFSVVLEHGRLIHAGPVVPCETFPSDLVVDDE